MKGSIFVVLMMMVVSVCGLSPMWNIMPIQLSSSTTPTLGRNGGASLIPLRYNLQLSYPNNTVCALLGFDSFSFNGQDLGKPLNATYGECHTNMSFTFKLDIIDQYHVTLNFAPTPYHATNVSRITVLHEMHTYDFLPNVKLIAKRKKSYDCQDDLTFHNSSDISITFHNLRVQAYLPSSNAKSASYSPRDPTADCPTNPTGGPDAALYFGIAIGALGGVGILLFIRHAFVRRPRSGYQNIINSDE